MYITRRDISDEKKNLNDEILCGYFLCLIREIEDEEVINSLNCYKIVRSDTITIKQAMCA